MTATPDATAHDNSRDTDATRRDAVPVADAARLLGVSVRTVQRRIERGELQAIEDEGKRFVVLPTATVDATRRDMCRVTVATAQATPAPSVATNDVLLSHLTEETKFLRLQLEEALRGQAELRAAVRELTKALNQTKALPAPGDSPEPPQATQRPAATQSAPDAPETAQGSTGAQERATRVRWIWGRFRLEW
jgi:excisionase family DNA binding protein